MGRTLEVSYMAVDPAMPVAARPRAGLMQAKRLPFGADDVHHDGPVCARVAVLDLDPVSGALHPGAPFRRGGAGGSRDCWEVADKGDMDARDFRQVSVYGAIRATMAIFERRDVLNRPVTWAFDGPQLLVVPQAGRMANAFYHRDSRSLQFFFFDGVVAERDTTVQTCLSPDIVAHECAHAILDGIAPDLYDATAPQSLALHEAVSDLTAFLFAAQSGHLRKLVLDRNRGDLRRPGALNAIAEQFGQARSGRIQPLRDLLNDKRMADVPSASPHALSEVLTGALYEMFLRSYEAELDEEEARPRDRPRSRFSLSGRVLANISSRFARIVLRALDYLPPGEVSFADYLRTIVAADAAANPDSPQEREVLAAEAVRRGILARPEDAVTPLPEIDLAGIDLDRFVADDATARVLVEAHRAALWIPEDAEIEMRPRLDVSREVYPKGGGRRMVAEVVLKVAWTRTELVPAPGGLFDPVALRCGTTLAIGRADGALRLAVTNSPLAARGDLRGHDAMRRSWLGAQLASGVLDLDQDAKRGADGAWRFRGVAQQLHLAGR